MFKVKFWSGDLFHLGIGQLQCLLSRWVRRVDPFIVKKLTNRMKYRQLEILTRFWLRNYFCRLFVCLTWWVAVLNPLTLGSIQLEYLPCSFTNCEKLKCLNCVTEVLAWCILDFLKLFVRKVSFIDALASCNRFKDFNDVLLGYFVNHQLGSFWVL
jgi:hypothetical protein